MHLAIFEGEILAGAVCEGTYAIKWAATSLSSPLLYTVLGDGLAVQIMRVRSWQTLWLLTRAPGGTLPNQCPELRQGPRLCQRQAAEAARATGDGDGLSICRADDRAAAFRSAPFCAHLVRGLKHRAVFGCRFALPCRRCRSLRSESTCQRSCFRLTVRQPWRQPVHFPLQARAAMPSLPAPAATRAS